MSSFARTQNSSFENYTTGGTFPLDALVPAGETSGMNATRRNSPFLSQPQRSRFQVRAGSAAWRLWRSSLKAGARLALACGGALFLSTAQGEVPTNALTLYSIGEPTDQEQLCLEYINRSRANPTAEALRLRDAPDPDSRDAYSLAQVDFGRLVSMFNALPAAPPLSFNSNLIYAARGHSHWMLTNNVQNHYEGDRGWHERILAAHYDHTFCGENISAQMKSVSHGHAAFDVDWTNRVAGGMQDPPSHRNTIHHPEYGEIGIGIVEGWTANQGPLFVTQDFGDGSRGTPLVTGVVYCDLNANGFYDLGEGLGGVRVEVSGSGYYAVSSASGGYSVPASNGTRTVTFSGLGPTPTQRVVSIADNSNVKVDCVLAGPSAAIAGPSRPVVNQPNWYSFPAVDGAANYRVRVARLSTAPAGEDAEKGSSNVLAQVSPGYSIIATNVNGHARCFHLAHPASVYWGQTLTLSRPFRAGTNAQIRFESRLGVATANEIARAQISTNGGSDWSDLWRTNGLTPPNANSTTNLGETTFKPHTNSLASLAGREFSLRFVYASPFFGIISDPSPGVGLYLDNLTFANVDELTGTATYNLGTNTQFSFSPRTAGDYLVRVVPQVAHRWLEAGPDRRLTATTNAVVYVASSPVAPLSYLLRAATTNAPVIDIPREARSSVAPPAQEGTKP
jgi:hypothetical protein